MKLTSDHWRSTLGAKQTLEVTPEITEDLFIHQYYDKSIKIIDCMLLGKERYLESVLQAVRFENVFYEETLENVE